MTDNYVLQRQSSVKRVQWKVRLYHMYARKPHHVTLEVYTIFGTRSQQVYSIFGIENPGHWKCTPFLELKAQSIGSVYYFRDPKLMGLEAYTISGTESSRT